jgi:hypothetical protein
MNTVLPFDRPFLADAWPRPVPVLSREHAAT